MHIFLHPLPFISCVVAI